MSELSISQPTTRSRLSRLQCSRTMTTRTVASNLWRERMRTTTSASNLQVCTQEMRKALNMRWLDHNSKQIHLPGGGCSSYVGRIGGAQAINYQAGGSCISRYGTVQHEMMHALGFYHEQSRWERCAEISLGPTSIFHAVTECFIWMRKNAPN